MEFKEEQGSVCPQLSFLLEPWYHGQTEAQPGPGLQMIPRKPLWIPQLPSALALSGSIPSGLKGTTAGGWLGWTHHVLASVTAEAGGLLALIVLQLLFCQFYPLQEVLNEVLEPCFPLNLLLSSRFQEMVECDNFSVTTNTK